MDRSESSPLLSARAARQQHQTVATWDFPIAAGELPWHPEPCSLKVQRVDLSGMLLTGAIQVPMLAAAMKFDEARRRADADEDAVKALESFAAEDGQNFLEAVRRFACAAIVAPRVVLVDDGSEDSIPVSFFPTDTLMRLLMTPPPGAPRLSEADAATFRGAESPRADSAGPDGAGLRADAVVVADSGESRDAAAVAV